MSRWVSYNANPQHRRVGDCTVRAISKVLGQDWYKTYFGTAIEGAIQCDMPSANQVWGAYLRSQGFQRHLTPDDRWEDYTVEVFCEEHPEGTYLLALDSHVVAAIDGCFYDTWDSGGEVVNYYWERKVD